MEIPTFDELMTSLDVDEEVDNLPEQKELEAFLDKLDAEIADGEEE
jgi:hypothetical protein